MSLLADLVDLVLPRVCAGCGVPAALLCDGCDGVLSRPLLGRTTPDPCPPGLPRTVAAAAYGGELRSVLLAHKERGRLALAVPLGALLHRAVAALDAPGSVLVPVPSARAAVRARGQDHALRLARAAAAAGDRPAAGLLRPARVVRDQSGLSAGERAANLTGSLVARRPLPGLAVVVVDDIMTTGATLVEAARALRAAGALVRGAAVVGATRRRTPGDGPPVRHGPR